MPVIGGLFKILQGRAQIKKQLSLDTNSKICKSFVCLVELNIKNKKDLLEFNKPQFRNPISSQLAKAMQPSNEWNIFYMYV